MSCMGGPLGISSLGGSWSLFTNIDSLASFSDGTGRSECWFWVPLNASHAFSFPAGFRPANGNPDRPDGTSLATSAGRPFFKNDKQLQRAIFNFEKTVMFSPHWMEDRVWRKNRWVSGAYWGDDPAGNLIMQSHHKHTGVWPVIFQLPLKLSTGSKP